MTNVSATDAPMLCCIAGSLQTECRAGIETPYHWDDNKHGGRGEPNDVGPDTRHVQDTHAP